jgi:hypothetical protein
MYSFINYDPSVPRLRKSRPIPGTDVWSLNETALIPSLRSQVEGQGSGATCGVELVSDGLVDEGGGLWGDSEHDRSETYELLPPFCPALSPTHPIPFPSNQHQDSPLQYPQRSTSMIDLPLNPTDLLQPSPTPTLHSLPDDDLDDCPMKIIFQHPELPKTFKPEKCWDGHVSDALKILKDAKISILDVVLDLLNPVYRDDRHTSFRAAIYSDKCRKISAILDFISEDHRGRDHLLRWMTHSENGIKIIESAVHSEMDQLSKASHLQSIAAVDSQFMHEWKLSSTRDSVPFLRRILNSASQTVIAAKNVLKKPDTVHSPFMHTPCSIVLSTRH